MSKSVSAPSTGYGYGGVMPAALGALGGNMSKYGGDMPNPMGGYAPQMNPFGGARAQRQFQPGQGPGMPQQQPTPPIYGGGAVNPFLGRVANGQPVQARFNPQNPLGPGHVRGSGAGANFVFGQDKTIPAGGWGSVPVDPYPDPNVNMPGPGSDSGLTGSQIQDKAGYSRWQHEQDWKRHYSRGNKAGSGYGGGGNAG